MLDAVSRSWRENPLVASAQVSNEGYLWESVKTSLEDCKATLQKLDLILDEVRKDGFLERGFLRRPAKTVKLNMKMKDIVLFRQQLHSYNNAMHSALQMINV